MAGSRLTSARTITLAFLSILLLACRVSAVCNTTGVRVPEPEVKYFLNGNITVTWSAGDELQNYSTHFCCERLSGMVRPCPCVCPDSIKIDYCHVENNDVQVKYYSCSFPSEMYLTYHVFLIAEHNGCPVRSVEKMILPDLTAAYPPSIQKVIVYSNKNGLEAKWQKPKLPGPKFCYFPTCHELEGTRRVGKVIDEQHNMTDQLQVQISFTGTTHAFKSYECCVKVRICGSYEKSSEERCNVTKTPEAAPLEAPKMLCGVQNVCPEVVKGNMRNVTVRWQLPDKSTWNGNSIRIVVKVLRADNGVEKNESDLIGVATQVTLTDLRTDVEYHVSLRMCTSAACGPVSTAVVINSNVANQQKGGHMGPFSTTFMAVISCSAIALMFLALVMCFIWDSKRNASRDQVGRLPPLHEPVTPLPDPAWSGDSVATSIFVNAADYDFLCDDHRDKENPCFPDTIFDESQGGDTSSLESYDADCTCPLLNDSSSRRRHPPDKRVMVTYRLAPTPETVSYLSPVDSDSDDQEFV